MTRLRGGCCGGGNGSLGAEVIYEVDWAAQATQTIAADGPVGVEGKTWTAVNVPNALVFRIVNGQGLQITTAGGALRQWNGPNSQVTAPALRLSLDEIPELLRPDIIVEAWHYFGDIELPQSSNSINAGWWGPETPYSNVMAGTGFAVSGGSVLPMNQRGTTRATEVDAGSVDRRVVIARYIQDGLMDTWSARWLGAWPTRDELSGVVGHDVDGYGSSLSTTAILRRPAGSANQSSFVVAAATNTSSAGDPALTLTRSRFIRIALA